MDILLLTAILLLILFFVFVLLVLKKTYGRAPSEVKQEPVNVARQSATRRVVSGAGARRRQRRLETREDDEQMERVEDGTDDEATDEKDELAALRETGKIGTKKLRKLEEKAERKAQREAADIERQERKARDEMREEERKKLELKREHEEADKLAIEEEIRKEKKRQEEEEYQRLKKTFTVDEEGTDAIDEGTVQNLLKEFIDHIKMSKVIMLEDLAAKFNIKTQEAIERVKTLQADQLLTGVIDDRGKFIYITKEEYEDVAKFIKQRGRVSIRELSESINQVIQLDGGKESVLIEAH